ncbi:hypothetical protein [Bradyrhizobium japonicum]|uniref:hypothetical protein n=1 Tax=Bradyrhizobium japonicum TaxID=375 RepID=UPI0012BD2317|nr:hypothetical protein [Bradyrhizobium japonicum]WLB86878.1 hypothetical protein QIH91_29160 [Bradyrhizobium japonicum USDA 135]
MNRFSPPGKLIYLFGPLFLPKSAIEYLCSLAPKMCTLDFGIQFFSLAMVVLTGSMGLYAVLMALGAVFVFLSFALSTLILRLMHSPAGFGVSSLIDTALPKYLTISCPR